MAAVVGLNLTKYFRDFKALDSVSFTVRDGECFSFLGPNGAGKTTLMSMIYGFVTPSEGEIHVLGHKLSRETLPLIKSRIGVVPQDNNLDPDLSVLENLIVYGRYFGMRKRDIIERSLELLSFVGLLDWKDTNVRKLSGGMKRKLVFVRALLNEPEILILDEPTTGLDPRSRKQIWDLIEALKHSSKTIILTTHYMEEAERLCDRIAIVSKGKILITDSPQSLSLTYGGNLESVYLTMTEER